MIMFMVKSIVKFKSLLHKFWGKTRKTLVYILNFSPTGSLAVMNPYELWTIVKLKLE